MEGGIYWLEQETARFMVFRACRLIINHWFFDSRNIRSVRSRVAALPQSPPQCSIAPPREMMNKF